MGDLNTQPSVCKTAALPIKLIPFFFDFWACYSEKLILVRGENRILILNA